MAAISLIHAWFTVQDSRQAMLAAQWIPKLVFDVDSKNIYNIYKQKYIHSLLHIKELGRDVSANYIFCGAKIILHIYNMISILLMKQLTQFSRL